MKQLKSLNASQNKRMRIIDFPTEGGRSRGKHPHYSPLLKKEYQHESLNHKPVKKEVLRLAVLSLEKDKPQRVIPQCEGRQ